MENLSKEQKKVIKDINKIMADIDSVVPVDWSKGQVTAMLGLYVELYLAGR